MSYPLDPDRSLWHLIAVEVRRQRELHQLSGNRLSQILDCDRSTVSRIENGRRRLSRTYAQKLDDLWATWGLFVRLVVFAGAADDGDWFTGLTDYEARSTHYRQWQALWVPGLLQTPDYARAALTSGAGLVDVEEALRKRLARQEVFFSDKGARHVSILLSWFVLEQPVGGAAIMRAQLARLLEISELPHASVRVVEKTAGAHVGLDGSFVLLTAGEHDVAFMDAAERGRLLIDPPDVQRFQVRYERISNVAAPTGLSRELIERAMESYR